MHRRLQREPVRLASQRVQSHLVATLPEAVQVLEDVPVAAADAGVLGHVDDLERPVGRAHGPLVEPSAPPVPEPALGAQLALALLGPAGRGLQVGQAGQRLVAHRPVRLPGPQAVVHVLVAHGVAVVQGSDGVDQVAAQVHARSGHGDGVRADLRRAVVLGLEAVAVVEPLGGAHVAVGARRLDPPVRVQQARAHDADLVVVVGRHLQRVQPAAVGRHVAVQHHHVLAGPGQLQAAVHAGGVAGVLGGLHELRAPRAPAARAGRPRGWRRPPPRSGPRRWRWCGGCP